jgi:hypothetical protein
LLRYARNDGPFRRLRMRTDQIGIFMMSS